MIILKVDNIFGNINFLLSSGGGLAVPVQTQHSGFTFLPWRSTVFKPKLVCLIIFIENIFLVDKEVKITYVVIDRTVSYITITFWVTVHHCKYEVASHALREPRVTYSAFQCELEQCAPLEGCSSMPGFMLDG